MNPDFSAIASLSFGVLVNTASGSSDATTGEQVMTLLAQAGVGNAKLWSVEADGLEEALREARAAALDVLVVFGGDGTISTVASASTMESFVLIPLPGGTMNLLPKALYGATLWEEALRTTLANPEVKSISGGSVGAERFFIAALFGAPVLWTRAREALRKGNWRRALSEARYALSRMFVSKIGYRFNELHEGKAELVSVMCPLISTTLADDRNVLEAAVIDVHGAGALMELATATAFGQWRDASNVAIVNTKQVTLSSRQPVPYVIDGELRRGTKTLEVAFVPEAFRVMVPRAS